jgi:hypothetical protein
MLRRVALVRTDVSEERNAFFIRVIRIGELETTLAATTTDARCEEIPRAIRRNTPEDTIIHSHRRENLKSYRVFPEICPRNRYRFNCDDLH